MTSRVRVCTAFNIPSICFVGSGLPSLRDLVSPHPKVHQVQRIYYFVRWTACCVKSCAAHMTLTFLPDFTYLIQLGWGWGF